MSLLKHYRAATSQRRVGGTPKLDNRAVSKAMKELQQYGAVAKGQQRSLSLGVEALQLAKKLKGFLAEYLVGAGF